MLQIFILCVLIVGLLAKKKERSGGEIVRKDLEHIKCGVCQRVAHELAARLAQLRVNAVASKIGEFHIVELLDTVCKPTNLTSGVWTRKLDIVENKVDGKTFLDLVEPGGRRKCNDECLTIAKSCDSLLEGEIDADDFSAFLYRNKVSGDELQVCIIYISFCVWLSLYSLFSALYRPNCARSSRSAALAM